MWFEALGFAIALAYLCLVSVVVLIAAVYCMSQYNIGGALHTWKHRAWIVPALIILYLGWSKLMENAPISIVIS